MGGRESEWVGCDWLWGTLPTEGRRVENPALGRSYRPQHFLNFLPEPQGQASLRPTFDRGPACGFGGSCDGPYSRRFLIRSSVQRTGGSSTPSGMTTLSSLKIPTPSGSCSPISNAGRTFSCDEEMASCGSK